MDVIRHSGYADFEWAIELNRYSLEFIGLWPKMEETAREKLIANIRVFLLIIMVTCVCVIPCIHSLIRVWGDLMSMTDNLQFTLPLVSMTMKLIIMWRKKAALAPILYMIAKDWLKLNSNEERKIMIRCARIPRMIIICGFVIMFGSFILLFILPCFGITVRYITNVTDPGKPLPLQTYYFYDTDTSPYFELTFAAQCVTLMVSAMGYTAIDSMFGLLVFHVCGQLENLKGRLMTSSEKNPNFDHVLANAVMDHVRLIRCVRIIENTFTLMLLGLFLYFGTLFSVYGFSLVTVITDGRHLSFLRLSSLVTVLVNIFAHMCLYCVVGECLITQCEGVYQAVCEYRWYELKPKQARNIILLMTRANKPLNVTVGKIFPLTMNSFCSLLKTSGGYISVLLARCSTKRSSTLILVSVNDMDISESSGYQDFIWAVELHRLSFEVVGLWPKTEKFTKKYQRPEIRVGIILSLLIIIFLPTICTFMHVWGNMVLVIDSLHIALPMTAIFVKYVIVRWKRTVLFAIVNMIAEDWMKFKHFTERTVMIRQAQSARLIMLTGYILVAIGFLIVSIPPYFGIQILYTTNFMNRSKLLPFETYHFYDTDKSPQYELTFLIQIISSFLASIVYISVDIFLVLIIFHICGQLEIFRCRLVSLVLCKNFNKVLNNIIATHVRLIRFAENIENMYSLIMLITVLCFAITFCLNGFLFTLLINKNTDKVAVTEIYFTIIFLISLLMNTFLYYGAGELITEQSNAVHRALCDLEWYKLESKKARNLILLMIRTHYPFRITAGKIIPLTLATFCSVLKTSCGYISFLMTKHG
ncbi:uncharacterized protein LOC143896080 [Temnothorax americanus]|uniref:uncharacterized protein LOC143896080 n=1 Tax=Temnothorax americanus TaxID=1964332 RepID=UPI00406918AC